MRELIKYELSKILRKKMIWLFALIIIIGTVMNTISEIDQFKYMTGSIERYKEELKPYEGEIDTKKQAALRTRLESIADKHRHGEKLTEEEEKLYKGRMGFNSYAYLNANPKYTINDRKYTLAEIKSELDRGYEDSYQYRNLKQAYKYISKTGKPEYVYRFGWYVIADFRIAGTMIVILILLGVSSVFSDEYRTNVIPIILSSKKGRNKLTKAKILSSVIYAAGVVVFVYTVYFISGLPFGLNGFNSMINKGYSWGEAPYALKVIEYYFMGIGMSLLGVIVLTLFINLISLLSKNSMITFVLGLGMYFFVSSPLAVILPEVLRKLSIYQLIRVSDVLLFYNSFNIFGHPIIYPIVITVSALIMIPVVSKGIKYFGMKQSV